MVKKFKNAVVIISSWKNMVFYVPFLQRLRFIFTGKIHFYSGITFVNADGTIKIPEEEQ